MFKRYVIAASLAILGLGAICLLASDSMRYVLKSFFYETQPIEPKFFPLVEYFPALRNPIQGVVVIVHGLNLSPDKMGDLTELFQTSDYDVYRLALTGHRGQFEELRTVTRGIWIDDFVQGYQVAKDRAQQINQPLYFVGFSLGALVGIDAVNSIENIRFDRMVLFAPALATHVPEWVVSLAKILVPHGTFKSRVPPEYQANDRGTVQSNVAVFDLISSVKGSSMNGVKIPTEVFIDSKDELVSEKGIKKLLNEKSLESFWTIESVSIEKTEHDFRIHHLIMDKPSLGYEEWNRVSHKILTFLK